MTELPPSLAGIRSELFAATGRDLKRSSRRRHVLLASLAASSAVVLALVMVSMLTLFGSPGAANQPYSSRGTASTTALASTGGSALIANAVPVAALVARTQAALLSTKELILHARTLESGGATSESWTDGASGARRLDGFDAQGQRLYSISMPGPKQTGTATVVDHASRSWWTYVSVPSDAGSPPVSKQIKGKLYVADPSDIQAALDAGTLTELGNETIDGRDTLHVELSPAGAASSSIAQQEMWIDSTTYLPVRMTIATSDYRTQVDLDWLPRTEENLGTLTLTPPSDFVHLAAPPQGRD